jgi:DNA-binding Xre family transcriptional regulator
MEGMVLFIFHAFFVVKTHKNCIKRNNLNLFFIFFMQNVRNYSKFLYICTREQLLKNTNMADINRIKVVLVEKKKTNKWLAEQLGKDAATISKWCTNSAQPSLETLLEIAKVLDVDPRELIVPIDSQKVMMSIL